MAFETAIQTLRSWVVASCETLSIILNQGVYPGEPEVHEETPDSLRGRAWQGLVYPIGLLSGVEGQLHMLLGKKDAATLVDLLVGGEGTASLDGLTDLHRNVLREAIQQLVTGLSELLTQIRSHPVKSVLSEAQDGLPHDTVDQHLWLEFPLELDEGQKLTLTLLLPVSVAAQLEPAAAPPSRKKPAASSQVAMEPVLDGPDAVQRPNFPSVGGNSRSGGGNHLELILDVPLQLQAVLGRTRLRVEDLIHLEEGSVLELDKLAGEPVELYVHDRLVALAEVIVVDERFGVKVLELVTDRKRQAAALAS